MKKIILLPLIISSSLMAINSLKVHKDNLSTNDFNKSKEEAKLKAMVNEDKPIQIKGKQSTDNYSKLIKILSKDGSTQDDQISSLNMSDEEILNAKKESDKKIADQKKEDEIAMLPSPIKIITIGKLTILYAKIYEKELKLNTNNQNNMNFLNKNNKGQPVNQVINNQPAINNQGMNNQVMNNQGMNNQGMNNQGMNNQGMNNQGMNNQGMNNQGMNNQGMNNQGMNNHNTMNNPSQQIVMTEKEVKINKGDSFGDWKLVGIYDDYIIFMNKKTKEFAKKYF